jgi:lysyl-tRNA synthetase class 2
MIELTEALVGELAREVVGGTQVSWDGVDIELAAPWRRLSVRDAVRELGGVAEASRVFEDPAFAAETAIAAGVAAVDVLRVLAEPIGASVEDHKAQWKLASERPALAHALLERYPSQDARRVAAGHLGYLVFEATAEAKLIQPTFLTDYPLAVSPLARKSDRDGAFCDRFEVFVNGRELGNGFSELNDPDDQRARFMAQIRAKAAGAAETMDFDEDYCRALEVGLPPTAGEGIGIDRLVMLLTGQSSIRDVILFPLMRPE